MSKQVYQNKLEQAAENFKIDLSLQTFSFRYNVSLAENKKWSLQGEARNATELLGLWMKKCKD